MARGNNQQSSGNRGQQETDDSMIMSGDPIMGARSQLEEAYNYHRNNAEKLERALATLDEAGEMFDRNFSSNRGRGGNRNNFNNDDYDFSNGGNRGRRNFAQDDDDGRTIQGRMRHDSEYDYDPREAWQNVRFTEDGSIDERSTYGRYLVAKGMVDDEGFPTRQAERQFGRYFNYEDGGNSGGRGRSTTSRYNQSSSRSQGRR
jgi:hypothetical protein